MAISGMSPRLFLYLSQGLTSGLLLMLFQPGRRCGAHTSEGGSIQYVKMSCTLEPTIHAG